MRFQTWIAALGVGAALLATPAAAATIDAECLWGTLSPARQTAMLQDYRDKGAHSRMPLTDAEVARFKDCGVTKTTQSQAQMVFVGGFMRRAGETVLKERYGITAEALDAAWGVVPDSWRDERMANLLSTTDAEPSDAAVDTIISFLERVKAPDEAIPAVSFYMSGRAFLEYANALGPSDEV